ncbi:MAG: type II toxin-antitoxin system prevent-host-death family antitoxin [Bacteroidetes bacterium]|nr:type II toxin-antitoxin system prevent-host-death family antitoxin [Bacteroidota bacterium]MCW5895915.1 type II toxin-antitoxin system prevent-host-death family antitoxin [Bacteroidota bacterium]
MGKVKEPDATYVVDRNGKKTAVIIGVREYERLMEDVADLAAIASRRDEKTVPWEQVKRRLRRDGLL